MRPRCNEALLAFLQRIDVSNTYNVLRIFFNVSTIIWVLDVILTSVRVPRGNSSDLCVSRMLDCQVDVIVCTSGRHTAATIID